MFPLISEESPNAVAPPADIGKLENDDHEHKEMLTPDHPGILARKSSLRFIDSRRHSEIIREKYIRMFHEISFNNYFVTFSI